MRVVPLEAFRDKVPFSVAIAAVERGFRALGRGEAALPDPMVLELREQQAEVHVKGAHIAGGRHIVLKVATGFYRNRARGLPSGDGMFLLLDADTGVPAVLLEEHGYLTDFRTAAAVALTLKYLAPKDTHEALLVGAGALARLTARAMLAQMPLARLTLWNRTRERAEGLAKELGQAVETRIAPALESAVRDHRVIVTATASTTPLVMASWVGCGTAWSTSWGSPPWHTGRRCRDGGGSTAPSPTSLPASCSPSSRRRKCRTATSSGSSRSCRRISCRYTTGCAAPSPAW